MLRARQKRRARLEVAMAQVRRFWRHITDGMNLHDLWTQFRSDANSSYKLYSNELDFPEIHGAGKRKHFVSMARQFFWAIVGKLAPARRVLLLVALAFIFSDTLRQVINGDLHSVWFGIAVWGSLLLLGLLILEVADKVVMKRDLDIAKEIQDWLLPARPPDVPGLEVAFATRAAKVVAGDYYDIFSRSASGAPDGAFLIAVADVAGKSIPAALLMATFQASLKTLARTSGSLIELAGRMNGYACGNSQEGRRFTTAFLAEYDPSSRTLTYVNAGHNPPILRRCCGTVERLQDGGIPLGIQKDILYESGSVRLESSDCLVIFTDGVTEAENDRSEEYGETRLLAMMHAHAGIPSALLNTIMVDVDRFVGGAPQHDDVTLMLLRVS